MKRIIVITALILVTFTAYSFDLDDRTIELTGANGYTWNAMSFQQREFFVYGWMLSNFAMRADAGFHFDGQMGELLEHYGPYADETAWHFLDLINEVYEQPGFLDVPLGVAAQLRHEYVNAIRDGARRPPHIRRPQ
jgi:hypothetical protein